MLKHTTFNRRQYLAGLSALAAAGSVPAGLALAKAPMQNVQAPAFYRFKIGAFEATVISDGPLSLGAPSDGVFSGVSKADMAKLLTDNFLPADNVEMDQNTLLINTGNQLVLFDTGDGGSKMFGPKSGRQLANLKAAGIDPKDIDAVVLTHAHADHCWGLMSFAGAPNFPNAKIYMTESDFDFWTDESKAKGDMMKPYRGHAAASSAEQGPHGVCEGRAGDIARHSGDGGPGSYRGPYDLRHHVGRQDAAQFGRHRASRGDFDADAARDLCL